MYTECLRDGCTAKALWIPKLCCPMQDRPESLNTPYSLMVNTPLCNDHFEELSVQDWLHGKMNAKALFDIIRKGHFLAPDLDRAFFVRISMQGQEYKDFVKLMNENA